jgi:hypothetical protein
MLSLRKILFTLLLVITGYVVCSCADEPEVTVITDSHSQQISSKDGATTNSNINDTTIVSTKVHAN